MSEVDTFQSRRGGEPPRLFLSELEEANESAWISSAVRGS